MVLRALLTRMRIVTKVPFDYEDFMRPPRNLMIKKIVWKKRP